MDTSLGPVTLDKIQLKRLAEHGIVALLPVGRLRDTAEYCWDRGETTGDARYCSLWRALDPIAEAFESDGYLRAETVRRIDEVIKHCLPGILDASTAEQGALLARAMREQLFAIDI